MDHTDHTMVLQDFGSWGQLVHEAQSPSSQPEAHRPLTRSQTWLSSIGSCPAILSLCGRWTIHDNSLLVVGGFKTCRISCLLHPTWDDDLNELTIICVGTFCYVSLGWAASCACEHRIPVRGSLVWMRKPQLKCPLAELFWFGS